MAKILQDCLLFVNLINTWSCARTSTCHVSAGIKECNITFCSVLVLSISVNVFFFLSSTFSPWSRSKAQVSITPTWTSSPPGSREYPWCQLIWDWSAWYDRASWLFSCCHQTPVLVSVSLVMRCHLACWPRLGVLHSATSTFQLHPWYLHRLISSSWQPHWFVHQQGFKTTEHLLAIAICCYFYMKVFEKLSLWLQPLSDDF